MITNATRIPGEPEPLVEARDDVDRGRELLLQAVSAWEGVMRATLWDSPTGHEFADRATRERASAIALADRADSWSSEIAFVGAAGICG